MSQNTSGNRDSEGQNPQQSGRLPGPNQILLGNSVNYEGQTLPNLQTPSQSVPSPAPAYFKGVLDIYGAPTRNPMQASSLVQAGPSEFVFHADRTAPPSATRTVTGPQSVAPADPETWKNVTYHDYVWFCRHCTGSDLASVEYEMEEEKCRMGHWNDG
jgi:hypothetical protein